MSFSPRTPDQLAAVWPAALDHVSASSLKQFARCPEQWRQVKLVGRRQRPAGAVIQGKADHAAIGDHFRAQTADGALTTVEVQDAYVTHFEQEVADEGVTEIDWGTHTASVAAARTQASKVKDAGVKLVGLYHSDVAPYFKAAKVETSFTLRPEGASVDVVGFIDAQGSYVSPFTGEPDGAPFMLERKTAGRVGMNPETVLQARIYQLAEPLDVDVHVSVKRGYIQWGDPALHIGYSEALRAQTELGVLMALRQIAFFYTQYGPDSPWPGQITHPWACNYCGFRDGCAWWPS